MNVGFIVGMLYIKMDSWMTTVYIIYCKHIESCADILILILLKMILAIKLVWRSDMSLSLFSSSMCVLLWICDSWNIWKPGNRSTVSHISLWYSCLLFCFRMRTATCKGSWNILNPYVGFFMVNGLNTSLNRKYYMK